MQVDRNSIIPIKYLRNFDISFDNLVMLAMDISELSRRTYGTFSFMATDYKIISTEAL